MQYLNVKGEKKPLIAKFYGDRKWQDRRFTIKDRTGYNYERTREHAEYEVLEVKKR